MAEPNSAEGASEPSGQVIMCQSGDPAVEAELARASAQDARRRALRCLIFTPLAWAVTYTIIAKIAQGQVVPLILAIVLAVLVPGLAIYFFVSAANHRKTAAMAEVCGLIGFQFTPRVTPSELGLLATLPLFNIGSSRTGLYVMRGELDVGPVALLQYSYVVGGGQHQQTHQQTVAGFLTAGFGWPDFQLRPKAFYHTLAHLFGYQAIDFKDDAAFTRSCLVRGPSEWAIRRWIPPPARAFFAGDPVWAVEVQSGAVAIYRPGKTLKADKYPEFLATALTILQQFGDPTSPPAESS